MVYILYIFYISPVDNSTYTYDYDIMPNDNKYMNMIK